MLLYVPMTLQWWMLKISSVSHEEFYNTGKKCAIKMVVENWLWNPNQNTTSITGYIYITRIRSNPSTSREDTIYTYICVYIIICVYIYVYIYIAKNIACLFSRNWVYRYTACPVKLQSYLVRDEGSNHGMEYPICRQSSLTCVRLTGPRSRHFPSSFSSLLIKFLGGKKSWPLQ
jgi:hypothetical protein